MHVIELANTASIVYMGGGQRGQNARMNDLCVIGGAVSMFINTFY